MRVLVCGWIGSTNLGDELVFAGVRRLLGPDAQVVAVSTDPDQTARVHNVRALDHRRVDRIQAAARTADLVVVGGGGLIQDETSPFNLPYHLSRMLFARLGHTPYVGLALGVGRLETPVGRRLATLLRSAAGVTVRDEPSLALLRGLDVPARLGADAALHLADDGAGPVGAPDGDPEPEVERSVDRIVVSLRPWQGPGGVLPVGWRRGASADAPEWFVPAVAGQLDAAAERTGLPITFVALQTDRDHALHQQVAAAMRSDAELIVPDLRSVLIDLARAKVVVAMRYHAGIGATLGGVPSVLVGYSPKVDALAASLGTGTKLLDFDEASLGRLADAIVDQADSSTAAAAVEHAATTLRARAAVNQQLLDEVTRP